MIQIKIAHQTAATSGTVLVVSVVVQELCHRDRQQAPQASTFQLGALSSASFVREINVELLADSKESSESK